MKKSMCFFMALLLVAAVALVACDQSGTPGGEQNQEQSSLAANASQGLEFTSNGDGTCTVTGIGTCSDSVVVVPERSPEGDLVTSIGDMAFWGCLDVTKIILPSGLLSIGNGAFMDCQKLSELVIPEGVQSVGSQSFLFCLALQLVWIPKSVTSIGQSQFQECPELSEIIVQGGNSAYYSENNCLIETATNTLISGCKTSRIPDGVVHIAERAFSGCQGLTEVVIPGSVQTIGFAAFEHCYDLAHVTLSEGLVDIGGFAFGDCTALGNVTIPESVTTIGSDAFQGCLSMTDLKIPGGVTSIEGAIFRGNISVSEDNERYHCENNCLIETATGNLLSGWSAELPNGITRIGVAAFSEFPGFTEVTVPEGVTEIREYSFGSCPGLTGITFPSTLVTIWANALWESKDVVSISVAQGNPKYHSENNCLIDTSSNILVMGCKASKIPDGIVEIGYSAFESVDITSISIPKSVTKIDYTAFCGCTNLTDVYYEGTEAEWAAIEILDNNEALLSANIHYNSVSE